MLDDWKNATQGRQWAFHVRSPELTQLTSALESYAQRATSTNLGSLKSALTAWQSSGKFITEQGLVTLAVVNQLKTYVAGAGASALLNVKASGVHAQGFVLYAPGDAGYLLDGDTPLPLPQRLPSLTPTQIQVISEALRRCRRAVEVARNALIGIAAKTALTPPLTDAERLFVDYFGAFDAARARTILANYKNLYTAFSSMPHVHDHRNTDFGDDCYAATHRGTVLVNVDVWLGRDFFGQRLRVGGNKGDSDFWTSAKKHATDATVGTMVHEFSHAVIDTVDVPPVKNDGSWKLTPDPVTWESPDNDVQASTPVQDKRVAAKEPRAAMVNADNYGQFAAEMLGLEGG